MPVEIKVGYGDKELSATLTAGRFLGEIRPGPLPEIANLEHEILYRLNKPVGVQCLAALAKAAKKTVIVTGDHTRVLPTHKILPVVVEYLVKAGIEKNSLTVIIGVGNHRPVTEEEKRQILGSLYGQVQSFHSRETGYSLVGVTTRGTPVEVSTPVAEADLVIALGNIEMHQLAGFSGGVKAIAAGTASKRALEHNHRLSTLQNDAVGELDGNIVRQDMEEFARTANLRFIVNAVMNEKREIVFLTAGDPVKSHRTGTAVAEKLFNIELNEAADIVIVSPGGSPKDDTVYQAQKSVKNALKAVKDGGIIILTAKCPEGFGDSTFEQWIKEAAGLKEIEDRTKNNFVLGGHKCAFIASAVNKAQIFMISEMKPEDVKALFFKPFSNLQEAVDAAVAEKGENAGIIVMPWGSLTVPIKI